MIVQRRDDESAERLLDRFRLMVQRSGVLREAKRKRHFVSRSERRRMARMKAVRRLRRNAEKAQRRNVNGHRGGPGRRRT